MYFIMDKCDFLGVFCCEVLIRVYNNLCVEMFICREFDVEMIKEGKVELMCMLSSFLIIFYDYCFRL